MESKEVLPFLDSANCSNGTYFVNKSYQLDSQENVIPVAIHASVIALIIVASVVLNSLVLILVARNKLLRYRSIMASLNIVVADLLLTVVFHFTSFLNLLLKTWAYSRADLCQTFAILTLYLIYVRWAVLGVAAVDKFCNVRFPFRYSKHSKKILILLTILAWLIPAVSPSLNFFPDEYSFRGNAPMCLVACLASKRKGFCNIFNISTFSTALFWGGVLPSILYTWMYYRGYRLKKAVKVLGRVAVSVSAGVVELQPMANAEKHTKETRAFVTLVLLFLTNLFTSIPQYMLALLRPINLCAFFDIPLFIHFIVIEVFLASVFLDPIMIMRNKDFRMAFKKMLMTHRKLNKPAITSLPSNENSSSNNTTPTPI